MRPLTGRYHTRARAHSQTSTVSVHLTRLNLHQVHIGISVPSLWQPATSPVETVMLNFRFNLPLVLSFLYTLLAQGQAQETPSCALPCMHEAIKQVTSCALYVPHSPHATPRRIPISKLITLRFREDVVCVCKNLNAIQSSATSCILKRCGQDTAASFIASQAQCRLESGTPTVPTVSE